MIKLKILNELNIIPKQEQLYIQAFTHTSYSNEHDECEKFVLNGEDFHAEVITLKDGRYMVLPFGFISKWASLDYIEKKFGENVVDKKTRKLKKEIILDNLNNLGTIITGFYVNPENIKKVVGH